MPKQFSSRLYVPFLGAAAVAVLFAWWGDRFGIGWKCGALNGAVAGFGGSCILLLFEWLERTSTAAKHEKQQRKEIECELFDGFPEQTSGRIDSLFAVLMIVLACATFWVPLVGLLAMCYAVYVAGRDDMAAWIGFVTVCLLLVSIVVTLIAVAILAIGN